ncbi:MAG TPA: CBS domain-containing protein [Bacteroidales bacterium]|nr:CBS domain-containing protein [Bacteroidales bacterium]
MTAYTTFYLSGVIGKEAFDVDGDAVGIIRDLLINSIPGGPNDSGRQIVSGVKLKTGKETGFFSFQHFTVLKERERIGVTCTSLVKLPEEEVLNGMLLVENMLDKQIVDMNGHKLVRVNDVRLVRLSQGTYPLAVDIGIEGLLRRLGVAGVMKKFLTLFNVSIPAKFILWDDVQAIDFSNLNIKLSKSYSKLHTLHPSDLADILEDLGKKTSMTVFTSLDEEKAADVLEELESHAQVHIVENLPVEKAADVLEKMPADEVADILDELEDDKAEMLLKEMEAESSKEVRELLEYDDDMVGSLMTTDYLSYHPSRTVDDILRELREKKPEQAELYNLFVTDSDDELIGSFTLRDLVIASPGTHIEKIMKSDPVFLYDEQDIDDIAETVSKYNLLAVPVVDQTNHLEGMVVVDDVVEDLANKRRTRKRK